MNLGTLSKKLAISLTGVRLVLIIAVNMEPVPNYDGLCAQNVMRLPTIRDVAREAGVGVGTVSRVLNNSPQVSPATRERVLRAIDILGYRPNQFARQLSRGAVGVRSLGVVSPFIVDDSFVSRLQGVQRALGETEHAYELIFYHSSSPERLHQRLLTIVEHSTVEGLLLIVAEPTPDERQLLDDAGIVYVGINDYPMRDWPLIGADNVTGGELATRYLLDLGHTRIGYVGDQFDPEHYPAASLSRHMGYRQALATRGIDYDPHYVQLGPHGQDVAYYLMQKLLTLPQPPTAVFCMSDVQALGCLAAIRDAGLSVPQDVSLIGFDDVKFSQLIGLTTVRQHLAEAGYLAMKYLLKLLGDTTLPGIEDWNHVPQLPAFEVVARQTTRPLDNGCT
jgi:DNA-binding LacI/PurR family transcriptional regulator